MANENVPDDKPLANPELLKLAFPAWNPELLKLEFPAWNVVADATLPDVTVIMSVHAPPLIELCKAHVPVGLVDPCTGKV